MANTNSNVTKVNKVTKFNAIRDALVGVGIENITVDGVEFSVAEFCNHEVELISNKKSTKAKVDNTPYFDAIKVALADGGLTPTELMAKTGLPNTQKVASIVSAMGDTIRKETKGKKVTYILA